MKITVHVNLLLSFLCFVSFFITVFYLHYTVNAFTVDHAYVVPSGHKKWVCPLFQKSEGV